MDRSLAWRRVMGTAAPLAVGVWLSFPPAAAVEMVQITLRFSPLPDPSGPLVDRTLSILPISDHTDPLHQVRKPERDLRPLAEKDLGRVVGIHYNMGSRAQEVYLGEQTPDEMVRLALEAEAVALGMTLVRPPDAGMNSSTDILSVFDRRPEAEIPDLAVFCGLHDFYIDVGPFLRGLQKHPTYAVRTWMRAKVVVFTPRTRQVHWSGFVTEQGLYEVAAKGAVMQQIQEGYRRFISGFFRRNSALREALAEGGPGESPDRLR